MSVAQMIAGTQFLILDFRVLIDELSTRNQMPMSEALPFQSSIKNHKSTILRPRRHDAASLDHQHHRALRRPRTMHHPFWYHHALSRRELKRPAFDVDEQLAFDDVKELVVIIVLVPVVFAFDNAE